MLLRISLIVAIIAGLAVGGLNFIKVKEKVVMLATDRDNEKKMKEQAQSEWRTTKSDLAKTSAELKTTKATLDATTTERDKAVSDLTAKTKEADRLSADLAKTRKDRD
ncbi:MAG: hypothetical protein ACREIC_00405, partial [Limisphaerales bacterium]